jgi:hypothetical protein
MMKNLKWETISPRMIKYFLIEFIEETKWKPEMLPVKKIKDLKKGGRMLYNIVFYIKTSIS